MMWCTCCSFALHFSFVVITNHHRWIENQHQFIHTCLQLLRNKIFRWKMKRSKWKKWKNAKLKLPSSAVLFFYKKRWKKMKNFFGFKFLISIDLHSNWHSSLLFCFFFVSLFLWFHFCSSTPCLTNFTWLNLIRQ